MTLSSIRMVTTGAEKDALYEAVKKSPTVMSKIVSLIMHPHVSLICKAESLWIMTNLTCFSDLAAKMIENYNAFSMILELFKHYYFNENNY